MDYKFPDYVISWTDMTDLAKEMEKVIGERKIHIFGSDWGGSRDLDRFMPYYEKTLLAPNTTRSNLEMSINLDKNNEFRLLRNLERSAENIPDDVKAYILFEDQATMTGKSAASGIIGILYGMYNNELPYDDQEVYLAAIADAKGIAHFSLKKLWKDFHGIKKYLEREMPKTYEDLSQKGLLIHISDYIPENKENMTLDERMAYKLGSKAGLVYKATKRGIRSVRAPKHATEIARKMLLL